MVHANFHEFLHNLADAGELRHVVAKVDPYQEIAEITDRVSKSPGGGKALLFSNVSGSQIPVATNLFGSERRLSLALGVPSLAALTGRMEGIFGHFAGSPADASSLLAEALQAFAPVEVASGGVWDIVDATPDFSMLPALSNWSGDGGRYFTLPLVFTADPATEKMNCGMYRLQVLDSRRGAINFGAGSGGGMHLAAYAESFRAMPVAVVLGGLPETIFSATVPLPAGINELALAGFLRRMPLEVTSVCGGTLLVPTSADVVIEGEIFPGESAKEGPFGNHTGAYAGQKDAPVLHVRRILRRHDAVIPATIVGPPPMEDCLFVRGWERLLLPWLRLHVPAVRELHFILAAAFHRAAVVVADATVTAEELVAQLRRTEPLKGSKLLVVVDPDVRPDAYEEVFWRVVNELPNGLAGSLIHDGAGIAVDARSRGKERVVRDAQTVSKVTRRWSEYGLDF